VAKAKRRGAHRKKRVRRPLPGMLRSRTARPIAGLPPWSATLTWWSRPTTPRGRSIRRSCSTRKARSRAFSVWPRHHRGRALHPGGSRGWGRRSLQIPPQHHRRHYVRFAASRKGKSRAKHRHPQQTTIKAIEPMGIPGTCRCRGIIERAGSGAEAQAVAISPHVQDLLSERVNRLVAGLRRVIVRGCGDAPFCSKLG
jgi:hypothetical protein